MTTQITTSYLSRRLGLPPLVAQAGYDAGVPDLGYVVRPLPRLRARLEVRRHGPDTEPAGYAPFRVSDAVLISGVRLWRVQLELMPWSADEAELGLRVRRGFAAVAMPSDAYFVSGLAVLDALAAQLRRWADEPLRLATAGHFGARDCQPTCRR